MLFILLFSISQSIRALETNTPASDAVPISVSIAQMTSQHGVCDTEYECTTDSNSKPDCGERCLGNNGHYFEYDFYGVQFQIYGSIDTDFSEISIYLNGNKIDTVSTSGTAQKRTLLYTSTVLDSGFHKIKVDNGNSGKSFGIYKFTYWPSIKAKRINFTDQELGGGGNWQKRSDGIGGIVGWINNADGVAQTTLPTSRIWIYGAKDPGNGNVQITIHKNDNKYVDTIIDESAEKKIEGCLLYDSGEIRFSYYLISVLNPNRIINDDKMYISLSYIFYEYDPPTQSPAPNPSPTVVPVSQDYFIDKTYHDYIPCGFPAIADASSPVKKITGCKFYNMYPDKTFYNGPIGAEIEFSNNLFEYDLGVENSAITWFKLNTKFKIDHCTFSNFIYSKKAGEGLIFSFNQQISLTFDSCVFNNIGRSEAHYMFKLNGAESVLHMLNCTFHNDENNDGSKISDLTNSNIKFDKCTFDKPARDMIRMSQTTQAENSFYFTNNLVQKCKKTFITAIQIMRTIYIQNNVFQDVDMISGYFISFTLYNYGLNVELYNNTFQRITTHTESSFGGGIASWYQSIWNKKVNLTYNKCHFYDITNNNEREPYNQGGALHYGYTTSISNVAVTLLDCEFKRNKCNGGFGGAVAFSIDNDLNISKCLFEDNSASSCGGAIYFHSKIVKPADNPNAPDFDGTIKIKAITITNCQFIGNTADDGQAIYIAQDFSLTNAKLTIKGCTFNDNGERNNMIAATIGEIDFQLNIVQFTDKSKSTGILYVNNENLKSLKLENNNFINCYYDQLQSIHIQCNTALISVKDCNFTNCQTGGHFIRLSGGNADVDSCTFTFENSDSASGAFDFSCNGLLLKNSNFFKTNAIGAIKFTQTNSANPPEVVIENCLFDQCVGANNRCFDLTIRTTQFTFRNIVFQNLRESGQTGYFVGINGQSIIKTLILENITFQDNRCNSFYGGGSGIWFTNIDAIKFSNCKFLRNIALKSPIPRDKTPIEATDASYYSGDGGGVQFGFSDAIYNVNMIFVGCHFIDNKAVRHGGALALQTVKNVEITDCTFQNNIANYDSQSSAELLQYENYYSKKTNGRGGAIYLNPAFNHIDSDSTLHMQDVKINGNNFEGNSAFDGYVIYIQGDDPGTTFEIKNNKLKDNIDENDSSKDRSAILSEIPNIQLPESNKFEYTDQNNQPKEIEFGEPGDTEDDGPDYFELKNVTSHGRNDYKVDDPNNHLIVTVILSKFHDIQSAEDGGALYIVNAGLACNDIKFENCSSENRGGAIFIHNIFETTNYGNVIRCNITGCSAKVGGGVFIFSNNSNYKVIVRNCNFSENSATATNAETLFGGSGAFIVAKNGKVKENIFVDNDGDGNALRLSNNIKMEITLSENKFEGKLIVAKNRFFVSESSDSSAVFYTRGKGGPLIELKDCIFEGKLKKGRHFIEGEMISDIAQKLVVKNCKFEGDASNAIPLDSDFLSINLNENHFDSVAAGIEKKLMKTSSNKSKEALTVIVTVAAVSIIAIVGFAIFFIRKTKVSDVDDSEMSFDA